MDAALHNPTKFFYLYVGAALGRLENALWTRAAKGRPYTDVSYKTELSKQQKRGDPFMDKQEHEVLHEADVPHEHTQTKAVLNRLSRAIGHLEAVRQMVEDGRDCSEVLIQLAAVRAALTSTGKVILKDHIEHCIVDAVEEGDTQAILDLEKAIDQFIK